MAGEGGTSWVMKMPHQRQTHHAIPENPDPPRKEHNSPPKLQQEKTARKPTSRCEQLLLLLSCLTRRCSRFPSQPNACSGIAARSRDNWSARSKRCPGGIRLGSPPCTHTHTHTRFCFPQTCTKVEAKSGGSPCAAQVWEHARMQRVCPDQFVTPKLGILSGLPPSTTFSLKRASDWDTGLGRPKRDSFCLCLNLAGTLETPGSTSSTGSSLGRLLN